MATIMAWLTANGATVGIGVLVVGLLFAVLNPDKVKALIEKIKGGDGISALTDAIKELPLVKNAKVVEGEVKNIAGYAEMKIASVRVLKVLASDKQTEVQAAFQTILTAIATADVQPDQAAVAKS